MGSSTNISWADRTFNPWMGCTKVSQGCAHCYAEREMQDHWKKVQWGPQGIRMRTGADIWRAPLRWNRAAWVECTVCGWRGDKKKNALCPDCLHPLDAVGEDVRQRVFCASLADVFEDRPEVEPWRVELFALMASTPMLDWMVLTKRPQNVLNMVPWAWHPQERWPSNVWIGTSIEDQAAADARIEPLLGIPAPVRFLSCGPLLEPVNLGLDGTVQSWISKRYLHVGQMIHWIIAEGESGSGARVMPLEAVRGVRDQAEEAGIPFHFKQWGEWAPINQLDWVSDDTRFRHEPRVINEVRYALVSKARAGRTLDGRTWNEYPEASK